MLRVLAAGIVILLPVVPGCGNKQASKKPASPPLKVAVCLADMERDGNKIIKQVMDKRKKTDQVDITWLDAGNDQSKQEKQLEKLAGQKVKAVVLQPVNPVTGPDMIRQLVEKNIRVVALEKPSEVERGQWYFQRYIQHLPAAGEVVFFDRSWYNRAGVERVMNFCTPNEYLDFMRQCPELERMFVNSGVRLYKYWFSVTREEQQRRFHSRMNDPLKQWKLSPIDRASMDKWDDYTEAKEAMFFFTDTADAPWVVIKSDDKKRARLNCMQHFLSSLDYPNKDHSVVHGPDPLIVGSSAHVIGRDQHILGKSLAMDVEKKRKR